MLPHRFPTTLAESEQNQNKSQDLTVFVRSAPLRERERESVCRGLERLRNHMQRDWWKRAWQVLQNCTLRQCNDLHAKLMVYYIPVVSEWVRERESVCVCVYGTTANQQVAESRELWPFQTSCVWARFPNRSFNISVGRAPDSWSEAREFDTRQKRREIFFVSS